MKWGQRMFTHYRTAMSNNLSTLLHRLLLSSVCVGNRQLLKDRSLSYQTVYDVSGLWKYLAETISIRWLIKQFLINIPNIFRNFYRASEELTFLSLYVHMLHKAVTCSLWHLRQTQYSITCVAMSPEPQKHLQNLPFSYCGNSPNSYCYTDTFLY